MKPEAALTLLLVTAGASVLPAVGRRLRVPVAIVEILFGLLIGHAVLGVTADPAEPFVGFLANLGFALFLFVSGLELDFRELERAGRKALVGAAAVALVGLLLAIGVSNLLDWTPWLGLAAGATSVPLMAAVLRELGRLSSPTGKRLLTLAALGEVITVGAIAMFELGEVDEAHAVGAALRLGIPVVGVVLIGSGLRTLMWWYPAVFTRLVAQEDPQELGLRVGLGIMFGFIGLATLGGIEPLLGAFLAGLTLAYVLRDKGALEHKLSSMAYGFFVPVFFIHVGMQLDLSLEALREQLPFVLQFLVLMLASKVLAGAWMLVRGLGPRDAASGALLLASPLTLIIAIADLAHSAGAIGADVEALVVGIGMIASLAFPTAARALLGKGA